MLTHFFNAWRHPKPIIQALKHSQCQFHLICQGNILTNRQKYLFSKGQIHPQSLLKKYERIKQGSNFKQATKQIQPSQTQQNPYTQNYSIRCEGCNVILQSKDKTKYGYITQKVLGQAVQQNANSINKVYGQKIKNKEAKILDFMHEVEKESGIKIFNQKTNQMENLDNVDVLMRLQQKIDKYEETQQLTKRQSKTRKQIICFRCFSLKHHNRLPQEYDNDLGFTKDTTQFIMNKMLNRHKERPVQYLFMIDAFDILGTFQEWLFNRLMDNNLKITLVVNKLDVMNKEYLNQSSMHGAVRQKLKQFLKKYYPNQLLLKQKLDQFKIFYISCKSRDGMKKFKQHIESSNIGLQLVGYPNTGKTTLLNILAQLKKSTSKVPGTTVKMSEHEFHSGKKRKIYDMPGLFSQNLLYNMVEKPSLKAILTWHKKISPGLLTNSAFIYGGKIEIQDVRIIVFGLGGACSSSNKWFLDHYTQFWKGLPEPSELKIIKHQIDIQFENGRADDLQIAGYGFIGFRLCIPKVKKTTRKLILYLPEKVMFGFRPTILSTQDSIFHNKSGLTKKFMLERIMISQKSNDSPAPEDNNQKQENLQDQK